MSAQVTILFSGGIDSTACLSFYLEQGFSVDPLFINYGQLSATQEEIAVKNISSFYKIPYRQISITGAAAKSGGLIKGRNAFLLMTGLTEFRVQSGLLAIGIHAGTNYLDCTHHFIRSMQSLFDLYFGGTLQIDTPFIDLTKSEIIALCKAYSVPLELTYSCELGEDQPCGICLSCKDLEIHNVSS